MKDSLKNKKKSIPVILIFILFLSFLFRFYKIFELFPFGMDQEYEIFLVKNIVNGINFPLIGVNAGDTGLYLGPIFIYLSVIPYLLFAGNPLGFAVTASVLGLLTTFVIFKVVLDMFSAKAAYFASYLYGTSYLAAYYDRHYWNPAPVPLFSILIGYFLYKIESKRPKFIYYLAVLFGLSLHIHLSLLIFTPLIIWIIVKNRKILTRKLVLTSSVIFILLQLPLFVFDLRHGFTNTKAMFNILSVRENRSGLIERSKVYLNYLGRFVWMPPVSDSFVEKGICLEMQTLQKSAYPEMVGLAFLCVIFFIYLHRQSANREIGSAAKIVNAVFILSFIAVFVYGRNFPEYYLSFLTPYLALLLGVSLSYFWNKNKGELYVFAFFVIFLLLNSISLFTARNSYSLKLQKEVIKFAGQYTLNQPYSLEALGDCPRFAGWRYLFEYYDGKPVSSYMDSYFGWLYPSEKYINPEKIVLLSMIDDRATSVKIKHWQEQKLNYLNGYKIISEKLFDRIHVFVLSPKK